MACHKNQPKCCRIVENFFICFATINCLRIKFQIFIFLLIPNSIYCFCPRFKIKSSFYSDSSTLTFEIYDFEGVKFFVIRTFFVVSFHIVHPPYACRLSLQRRWNPFNLKVKFLFRLNVLSNPSYLLRKLRNSGSFKPSASASSPKASYSRTIVNS